MTTGGKRRTITHRCLAFLGDDSGATAVEYALIAAAVGLAIAPIMPTFRAAFVDAYTTIAQSIS